MIGLTYVTAGLQFQLWQPLGLLRRARCSTATRSLGSPPMAGRPHSCCFAVNEAAMSFSKTHCVMVATELQEEEEEATTSGLQLKRRLAPAGSGSTVTFFLRSVSRSPRWRTTRPSDCHEEPTWF